MKKIISFLLSTLFVLSVFISCKTEFNTAGNIRIVLPGTNDRRAEDCSEFLKTINYFTLVISKVTVNNDPTHDSPEAPKVVKNLTLHKNTEYKIKLTPGDYYFDLTAVTKSDNKISFPLIAEDGQSHGNKFHIIRGDNILKFEFANVQVQASDFSEIINDVKNAVPFQLTTINVSQNIDAEDMVIQGTEFDGTANLLLDYGKKIILKSDSDTTKAIKFPKAFSTMFLLEDMSALSIENIECIWNKQGNNAGDLAAPFFAYDRSELTLKDVTLSLKMDTARTIIQSHLYPEIVFNNVTINDNTSLTEKTSLEIINVDETGRDFETGIISINNLTCNSSSSFTDFQIRTADVYAENGKKGVPIGFINEIKGLNSLYVKDYMSITGQDPRLANGSSKIQLYLYDNGEAYKKNTETNRNNTSSDVSPWKKDIFEFPDNISDIPGLSHRTIGDNDQVYKEIIKGDNSTLQPYSLLTGALSLNNEPFTASYCIFSEESLAPADEREN